METKQNMKTYTASFIGRMSGAIGITYPITTTVVAADEQAALLALYDNYEHIFDARFVEVQS